MSKDVGTTFLFPLPSAQLDSKISQYSVYLDSGKVRETLR